MKKVKVLGLLFVLTSCSDPNVKDTNIEIKLEKYQKNQIKTYEWQFKGHTYLIAKGQSEFSITHAGHCICNNKK